MPPISCSYLTIIAKEVVSMHKVSFAWKNACLSSMIVHGNDSCFHWQVWMPSLLLSPCLIIDAELMLIECNYTGVVCWYFSLMASFFFQCYPEAEYAMGKTMQTQHRRMNRPVQHILFIGWVRNKMCNCWLALKILALRRGWELAGLTGVSCFGDACLFKWPVWGLSTLLLRTRMGNNA